MFTLIPQKFSTCVIDSLVSQELRFVFDFTYYYFNKRECDLNQSKDDSFVKRVAKNNDWNNGDCHKIPEKSLIVLFSL